MIHPRLLLLLVLLCCCTISYAQVRRDSITTDTSRKIPLKTVAFSPENFNFGNNAPQDSLHYSLDSFQLVHRFMINTGNLGSPGHYLIPEFAPAEPFSVRPDAFYWFGFNRYNRRFYNTNQPYTLLQYFIGQPREQYVDVLHTRNFGNNLNFSFHFIRARSEGFYKRQNTSNTSLQTNLWYKSPGKRYALMADVFWTGANVAENGGLADDSSFEYGEQVDRQVNEVNLNAAGTVQRKRDLWVKHTFALGNVIDTIQLDSVRSRSVILPAWGISVINEVYDEKYNYTDGFPTSGFYDVIYRDSLYTNDSTYCWRVNNSVHLERFNQYGRKNMRGYIGARHEAGEYFNDTIYKHFQNIYAEAFFYTMLVPDSTLQLQSHGYYVVSGHNKGNYAASADLMFSGWNNTLNAGIHFGMDEQAPDYIYQHYSGNHLQWTNDFSSYSRTQAKLYADYFGNWLTHVRFAVDLRMTEDPLYFDTNLLPAQYNGRVVMFVTQMRSSVKFGWFRMNTAVDHAQVSNTELVRVPEWTVVNSMYADFNLFKSAMQMQAGIDVVWFSDFAAEGYMPNIAQFYLPNSMRPDARLVGNYTYISPWVSFRVKPVRFFVKAEHVNAGLMGRKYFLLDHYPANDLALKIGISWLFSD